jgi:NAD(P)H-hydrate epimerase
MRSPSAEVTSLPALPERKPDSHKGNYGRVLVVAGSVGMAGAGALSALSALRAGAGLVTLFVPARVYDIAATLSACVMTRPSRHSGTHFTPESLDEVTQLLEGMDVLALGPGLGRTEATGRFARDVITAGCDTPLVLDADGLYAVREHHDVVTQHNAATILTPHPGELSFMTGSAIADIQSDRVAAADGLARETTSICLLKGHRTVIADGQRHYVNSTGNAGMASAGSGDVLTGVLGALLGQGLDGFGAACLGAHVHGLAGDLAARTLGETSLIATDLIDHLPGAFRSRANRTKA